MTEILQSNKKPKFLRSLCQSDCVLIDEIVSIFTREDHYNTSQFELMLCLRNGTTLTYTNNIKTKLEADSIYNNLVDYLEGKEIADKLIESDRTVDLK